MNFLSTLIEFARDLRAQKLRSSLTIFGITWGTVAVIVLLAFGTGFMRQTRVNMHGIGDQVVIVFPGRTTKVFQGLPDGRRLQYREDDVRLLAREIPEIKALSAEYTNGSFPAKRDDKVELPATTGVYPIYADIRNIIPQPGGRFLNDLDEMLRRRVVFLGDSVAKRLFGAENPHGQYIMISQVPFLVIGVLQHKTQNSSYNSRDQDRVFIPASTFASVFGTTRLSNFIYQTRSPLLAETVKQRLYEVLGRRYRFDPADKDALMIWDTTEFDKMLFYFFLAFNIFLGVIGSFTLTVGGIGVANIMYVVVRERTLEIGIKRSVGAHRRHILWQFFSETIFIVAIGAILGFLISYGIVKLLGLLPIEEFVGKPVISPVVAMATMSLLAVIAILAGFFPARRAANLDPVECLRS
jgi:putative ABC transport system permease protein